MVEQHLHEQSRQGVVLFSPQVHVCDWHIFPHYDANGNVVPTLKGHGCRLEGGYRQFKTFTRGLTNVE
jgi:hypothetical protein